MTAEQHDFFMQQCINLGKKAMLLGDPPVGSIVVKEDKIIGIGIEAGKSSKDITKHAEIEAVKDALNKTGISSLAGCSLYTTHEPCIMCSYVIRHYRIQTLIYGTSVPYVGGITSAFNVMQTSDIPLWDKPPEIIENILKEACDMLSKTYNAQSGNTKLK